MVHSSQNYNREFKFPDQGFNREFLARNREFAPRGSNGLLDKFFCGGQVLKLRIPKADHDDSAIGPMGLSRIPTPGGRVPVEEGQAGFLLVIVRDPLN